MGKGDKKSKRGKITIGSYGVRRKRKTSRAIVRRKPQVIAEVVAEKPAARKTAAKTKKIVKAEAAE
jgi:30S ribosomal protein S31